RETAPAALRPELLQHSPDPARASSTGPLSIAVPGEPTGLVTLSRRFGRVPLVRAAAPAVTLARRGFRSSPWLSARVVDEREHLVGDPMLSRIFLPGGVPIGGDVRLQRPLLATTIERFGREGERFINGVFATSIERTVRAAGGVLTAEDVRTY